MSYIGFMRNTVNHIEKIFMKYYNNKKIYPSVIEKEDYKNFIFQMERIYRYGEMEDELEFKRLLKRAREYDLTRVVEMRKTVNKGN